MLWFFFFSSRRRHTMCALVTGVQTCALPIFLPDPAAPAPGKFEAAFRRQAEAGADAVVCINLSSGLSATMQSAQNAARALEGELDVRVVDSRSITSGLGTQVLLAEIGRAHV